jgi:hypothetical protein
MILALPGTSITQTLGLKLEQREVAGFFTLPQAMNRAQFRFLGKLNDLLPEKSRGKVVLVTFNNGQTVKHLAGRS